MARNSFSYGTTIKLNGSNYEIWSKVFIMSVAGHRKRYVLEEDEPTEKRGKYLAWEKDNYIVVSLIMNNVESHIAPTIAYYTKAKDMWSFLRKTYSHATNVIKILQLEEELCNIRQGDQDLSQSFATLVVAYERLKALRPPCQHCYASHFETDMPMHDTTVSALVISGRRGHRPYVGARGRGADRGVGCGRSDSTSPNATVTDSTFSVGALTDDLGLTNWKDDWWRL
ncbi:hypothetical protein EJ110_NYTH33452 [Nymphaea thermarum]|nr:hypothetical protein EJ110_NYTH33452 [Nymphaea thermarum]